MLDSFEYCDLTALCGIVRSCALFDDEFRNICNDIAKSRNFECHKLADTTQVYIMLYYILLFTVLLIIIYVSLFSVHVYQQPDVCYKAIGQLLRCAQVSAVTSAEERLVQTKKFER